MFSGFSNVNLPKDANMIPENAQVMVMMPARASSAEASLANLKNILVGLFLLFLLAVVVFLYFNLQKEKSRYEGQVLPGVMLTEPLKMPLIEPTVLPLASVAQVPPSAVPLKVSIAEPLEQDIVHIIGEIPTWPDEDLSDEIDKKVTDTDESIISKLKSREAFIKDLGENVAAMAKTVEKI